MRRFVLALFAALAPLAAAADTMTWRVSTVIAAHQGVETLRRGVAIFSNGETATLRMRLRPTAQPAQGRMPFSSETTYRFEDGSTFTTDGKGVALMSPEGAPLPGEILVHATFVAGTGRYSGITGTVVLRSRSGLDHSVPGVMSEHFSFAEATYSINK